MQRGCRYFEMHGVCSENAVKKGEGVVKVTMYIFGKPLENKGMVL